MRILSGIQPTGDTHLGNLVGALRHYVTNQELGEAFYFVADLHALTMLPDPDVVREATLRTAAMLLAVGVDPDRATLFVQSHVGAEHAQLAWLLHCVATFGELQRMTQFKEKGEGKDGTSLGLFTYPVLQAADVLLYDADRVPVGADQKQHLELVRNLGAALQPPLRRDVPRPGSAHRRCRQPRGGPAGPAAQDVDLQRHRPRARSGCSTSPSPW